MSLDASGLDLSKYDLKITEEIKPEISLYPKRGLSLPRDILKMSEMPLVAIDILSPKQSDDEIVEKFNVYFELGIKSCWFVNPLISTVTVYSAIDQYQTFSAGDVIDNTLGIHLPLREIFS